ncbi:MAG: glucose-1-phosphate cytidylyltransferase [Bacillota bacterium]
MQAVILCGGKGTRLREETVNVPKPLVRIGEMPVLWHIMKAYETYGVREFVLCLGYKGELIKDYFLNIRNYAGSFTVEYNRTGRRITYHDTNITGWKITLLDTGRETNTGGRLLQAAGLIKDQRFFATYGDGVCNVNIKQLHEYHLKHKRVATLTAVRPPLPYGLLEADDGVVKNFREKPPVEGLVNGGFFVFDRKIFDYLDADCVLEEEPFRKLVNDGQLCVYEHRGFWMGMDTYKQYEELNRMWSSGNAPWKVW